MQVDVTRDGLDTAVAIARVVGGFATLGALIAAGVAAKFASDAAGWTKKAAEWTQKQAEASDELLKV